jgi:hypothetical protein
MSPVAEAAIPAKGFDAPIGEAVAAGDPPPSFPIGLRPFAGATDGMPDGRPGCIAPPAA